MWLMWRTGQLCMGMGAVTAAPRHQRRGITVSERERLPTSVFEAYDAAY